MEKLKIAICLSGLIRTAINNHQNFLSSLMFEEHQYDIFISTWDISGRYFVGPTGAKIVKNIIDYDMLSQVYSLYKPKKYLIEDWEKTLPFLLELVKKIDQKTPGMEYKNIVSMYYKIKSAFDLIGSEKYDFVVRARLDVTYNKPILYSVLDPRCVYIPYSEHHGGYNDRFAVGNKENMRLYCDVINNLDWLNNHEIAGEKMLKKHLEFHNLIYLLSDLPIQINIPVYE